MPKPTLTARKVLLGESESELRRAHDELEAALGGGSAAVGQLAKFLNDPNANSYVKIRAMQQLFRMKEKLDAQSRDGSYDRLSDDEVEKAALMQSIQLIVHQPEPVYREIIQRMDEIRRLIFEREAQTRLLAE